jgi:prepilin-type N-terminal cleavage/methylation domain-containing protein
MKSAHHNDPHGFSLIELIVALCIIAIIAAIAIPVYSTVQVQAEDTVAQQMQEELNNTYANWKTNGGSITGTPFGSTILYVLGSSAAITSPVTDSSGGSVADNGISSTTRASLPCGTPNLNPSVFSPSNVVVSNGYFIGYSSSQDQFSVIPSNSIAWGTPVGIPIVYANFTPPNIYSAPLSYNGVNFGTLVNNTTSGTLYGVSGSTYYQASYTYTGPLAMLNKSPIYYASFKSLKGHTPYHYIGGAIPPSWSVIICASTTTH